MGCLLREIHGIGTAHKPTEAARSGVPMDLDGQAYDLFGQVPRK
jgi:hypothetical protein